MNNEKVFTLQTKFGPVELRITGGRSAAVSTIGYWQNQRANKKNVVIRKNEYEGMINLTLHSDKWDGETFGRDGNTRVPVSGPDWQDSPYGKQRATRLLARDVHGFPNEASDYVKCLFYDEVLQQVFHFDSENVEAINAERLERVKEAREKKIAGLSDKLKELDAAVKKIESEFETAINTPPTL